INIALTDLRKAQMPVADQLVSEIPRHPSDVERHRRMFENRTMPLVDQVGEVAGVAGGGGVRAGERRFPVAVPPCLLNDFLHPRHSILRVRHISGDVIDVCRVGDNFNQHSCPSCCCVSWLEANSPKAPRLCGAFVHLPVIGALQPGGRIASGSRDGSMSCTWGRDAIWSAATSRRFAPDSSRRCSVRCRRTPVESHVIANVTAMLSGSWPSSRTRVTMASRSAGVRSRLAL